MQSYSTKISAVNPVRADAVLFSDPIKRCKTASGSVGEKSRDGQNQTMMLSVENIRAGYGEIEVLHGVSLHVDAGEIVTLIGANGAGKTTLLKTISGVIKSREGSIKFEGGDIQKRPPHEIVRAGITQAPEGRAILTRMTVAENLLMGAYVRKDGDVAADMADMYEKFPALKERASEPASVLSGGQQQMLAIARALMARPRLLLLDEPSLGLAPIVVVEIFRSIRRLREEGLTILIVEQNARQALQLADRGYVLERGNIVLEGSGENLLNDEEVERMYLGKRSEPGQKTGSDGADTENNHTGNAPNPA